MIRLGYVGVNTLLPSASTTFRIKNYSEERMLDTAFENISNLRRILIWNKKNDILVFRITSNLIPYGSSDVNSGSWKTKFAQEFADIGQFITDSDMRVSMHPGQYTVINTPSPEIYQNTMNDLNYHNSILQLMNLDTSHRIIIHAGGGYETKSESLMFTITRLLIMDSSIKDRLALENDDAIFNAEDIYEASSKTGIPAVFDVFHHELVPSFPHLSTREIILKFKDTWPIGDRQKIHYSDQEPGKPKGSHSEHVDVQKFQKFYDTISDLDLDIMLEVKDKQASLLEIRQAIPKLR